MSPVKIPKKETESGADISYEKKLISLFLEEQLPNCQTVQLFSSSSYASQAPIEDLYVSMPTNVSVDLTISRGAIKSIVEQTNIQDEIFNNYVGNKSSSVRYDSEKLNKISKKLSDYVEEGKEYFYPELLERPLIVSPPWTDGLKENYWVLSIGDIVSLYDRVIVLGGPGTGKSTSLRYLAARLILHYLESPYISEELLSDFLFEQNYIPVFIEVRDFSKWLSTEKKSRIDLNELKGYLYSLLKHQELTNDPDAFWNILKQQNVIFIFDGLDEAYSPNTDYQITQQKLRGLTARLTSEFKTLKILFSSRIGEYVDYQLSDYKMVKLVSMHQYKTRELIQKIYKYHGISYDDKQISNFLNEMQKRRLQEDISGNPLLLSLIVAIAMNTDGDNFSLPKQKSHILYEGIKLLIDRWYTNEERPEFFKKYTDDEILAKLKHFAYGTNENGLINVNDLMAFVQADYQNANDILDYLLKRAGLIVKKGNDYEFAHKSFRSYLAASYIVDTVECTKYLTTNNRKRFQRQQEESILVVDILFDTIKSLESNDGSISQLWSIITLLVYTSTHNEWDIWLAGKMISRREYLLLKVDNPLKDIVIQELKKLLLAVFKKQGMFTKQDLDTNKRLECGEILGELGDLRDGVGVKDGIPDISWCSVDSGNFLYGISETSQDIVKNTKWGKDCIFTRELPTQSIDIDAFEISKYPITVRQFKAFIEDPDGYYSRFWYLWSDVAKSFFNNQVQNKTFVFPPGTEIDNYPATNVAFIEAVAFCKWLSYKTNSTIRLPSDCEWEYVAKQNGNIFTWGEEFDKTKCNSLSSAIGHICPVGSFTNTSASDNTPVDLCGNTWEWTQSFYTESHEYDLKNTIINVQNNMAINESTLIADRGGCYLNGPNCLRVSFRGRDPITSRADRYSFRVIKECTPFTGEVLDTPNVQQEFTTTNQNIQERSGYGCKIQNGDNIKIWYSVQKNGVLIQQETCELKLGNQKVHPLIENMFCNKRVASYFNIEMKGSECFGQKSFCRIEPNDTLKFDISIMDIFD